MNTLIIEFVLPVLTALLAWFGNAYRNKQKKERDVLENVQQIIDMQNAHIERCDQMLQKRDQLLEEREVDYRKLEDKWEHKVKAVKEAYDCKYVSDGCPVLKYDKATYGCDDCALKNSACPQ